MGQRTKKPAAGGRPALGRPGYASLMRFARGPFWLGSISKLTRSPPARESKFTLESRPVRWKKYSLPSSAAIKPNPRSETSFLMVPVGIALLLFSKACHERTGPFEKIPTAANIARHPGDEITLPPKRRPRTVAKRGLQAASKATPASVTTAPESFATA